MENKNLILEEIKRVKLLMGYKTEKTLTENESKVRINEAQILSEQGAKALLKGLFGGADDATRAATVAKNGLPSAVISQMDDALKYAGEIRFKNQILTNSDDVIKAMESGELKASQVTKIKNGFLKSGNVSPELRKVLVDQMSRGKNAQKLASLSKEEIVQVLKKNGYQGSIADDIAYKIKDRFGSTAAKQSAAVSGTQSATGKIGSKTTKGKTVGSTTATKGKGRGPNKTAPKKTRAKRNQGKIKKQDGKPTRWQQFKDKIKGMSRTKIFKYLLLAGGLYLLWRWWMDEGSAPFPDCIGKNIPEEDFERMVDGDGSVLISDTGVEAIDRAGGGRFYDDKKFVTGNGKYTGTWEDAAGVGVVITIAGNEYTMSCEGVVSDEEEDDEDNTGGGGGGGTSYTPCSSFPYAKGCQSEDIKKVQSCLGITADGKFGPMTEKALTDKGYSVPLSKTDFDTIMKKCGTSSDEEDMSGQTPDVYSGGEGI